MFVTSVSGVKKFWESPATWYIEFVLGRVVRRKPVALQAGIYFHQFMDELLTTGNRDKALLKLRDRFQTAIAESEDDGLMARAKDFEREMDFQVAAGQMWKDLYEFETLDIETAAFIDIDHADLRIIGRPDREVRLAMGGGRIGHFQHRTLAANKNVNAYLDSLKRNPHEGVYWKILAHKYHEEPFGTLLNLVRKIKPDRILAEPDVAIQQHPVFINEEQAQATLDNVIATTVSMRKMIDGELPIYQNTDMDMGQFGNSLTPYLDVLATGDLHGTEATELLADDDKYTDAVDRYPELASV